MKNIINSQEAVSGPLGFLLILMIVLLASGLVYVGGSEVLELSKRNTHFDEMQPSFVLLAQNLDKVGFDKAPVRNTELKISSGELTVAHDSSITIRNSSGGMIYDLGSIEYVFDDKTIAYENGAVWVLYPSGAVIALVNPHIVFANTTTIPALELIGDYSTGGEGIVRINGKIYESFIKTIDATAGNVSVEIRSPFYRGWADYLNETGAQNVVLDASNSTVLADIATIKVNVERNRILTVLS